MVVVRLVRALTLDATTTSSPDMKFGPDLSDIMGQSPALPENDQIAAIPWELD
jgi:hypothetical protein